MIFNLTVTSQASLHGPCDVSVLPILLSRGLQVDFTILGVVGIAAGRFVSFLILLFMYLPAMQMIGQPVGFVSQQDR